MKKDMKEKKDFSLDYLFILSILCILSFNNKIFNLKLILYSILNIIISSENENNKYLKCLDECILKKELG
jgi:hypothetical protein